MGVRPERPRVQDRALRKRLHAAMTELYHGEPPKAEPPEGMTWLRFVEALETNLATIRYFKGKGTKAPTDPAGPRLRPARDMVGTPELAAKLRKMLRPLQPVKWKTSAA